MNEALYGAVCRRADSIVPLYNGTCDHCGGAHRATEQWDAETRTWRTLVGEDADPLNWDCGACGAQPGEPCHVGCIGKAQYDDANDVLGRTTGGSPLVRAEDLPRQ